MATVMTRQDKTMLFLNVTYLKRRAMGLDFVAQDPKRTMQAVLELVPLIVASSMPNCISHKFSSYQDIILPTC